MTGYWAQNYRTAVPDRIREATKVFGSQVQKLVEDNAAIRTHRWGYANSAWYAEGTDGWTALNLEQAPSVPVPVSVD